MRKYLNLLCFQKVRYFFKKANGKSNELWLLILSKYGGSEAQNFWFAHDKKVLKLKEMFTTSSYYYEESLTYGKQLENGTWIGMVGQVSRQVHTYLRTIRDIPFTTCMSCSYSLYEII